MKETFAKFGLNMNMYNPGSSFVSNADTDQTVPASNLGNKVNSKVQQILDLIPDYGFLLDTKLSLP